MARLFKILTREEVEQLLHAARSNGKAPDLTRERMPGVDLSGLDFTSAFRDESGFNACYIGTDFRHANLTGCNFSGSDLADAVLRGSD